MENNVDKNEMAEQKKRLKSFLRYIKSKRAFIITMLLLGLSFGITYSFIKKPVYTATLTFSLQEETKMGGGGLLSLASSFGLDVGSSSGLFSGENIEQVFKSRKILEQTLLQKIPTSQRTYGDCYLDILNIRKKLNLPESFISENNHTNPRLKDSIIGDIHKLLDAGYMDVSKPDKKYDIYEITFKSSDENFSKYFVQELINQVSLFYTETKTKKAHQNVDVLQKRVDSIHNALGDLIFQKASFSDANLNPIFQKVRVPEQKKQIDMTALGTGYGELLKNLELAKYTLMKETPLFQIIDEPKFPLKKKTFNPILYGLLGSFVFFILSIGLLITVRLYSNIKQLLSN